MKSSPLEKFLVAAAFAASLAAGAHVAGAQDGALIVPPPPSTDVPPDSSPYNPVPKAVVEPKPVAQLPPPAASSRLPEDLPADALVTDPPIDPLAKVPATQLPVVPVVPQPAGTYRFPHPAGGQDWVMTISPAPNRETAAAKAYREAYESIPYHRAEYLANPAYRHEAAMEILFGQQRPTVIQKQQVPERVVNPVPVVERPYLYSRNELYGLYPRLRYGAWAETPFIPAPIP